ncbi:MAG: ABC transporter ATP-binding protein [Clostridia bacterium]|nr:ABC transporter ATP-binding protein [Clostridia bacterium]
MAGLSLTGVNKVYPSGALALYNVSLHLGDGEFVAVIGGEKSGKTSLLRVIAGLEQCNGGKVELGARDITEVEPRDRDIAMIFNSNTLYPSLNVYDNMAYGLRMRKASNAIIDERVNAVAAILGLENLLARKPKTLTSAQKQKVAFGRAIVREPKIYLFDDPLSGFDGKLKEEMQNIIVNLQVRMSGTFVYATKNVTDALSMATRVIVMKDGMVQQIDTPANLYDYPQNAYVAFYVGNPTINFINDAELVSEDGKLYFKFRKEKMPLPQRIAERFDEKDEYVDSGRKLILGIRPEDARQLSRGEGEGNADVALRSTDSEYVMKGVIKESGDVSDIYFSYCEMECGQPLAVYGAGEKDTPVTVVLDLSRLQVFDSVTRLSLLSRDEGYVKTGYADADRKPLTYNEEEEIKRRAEEMVKKAKTAVKKK